MKLNQLEAQLEHGLASAAAAAEGKPPPPAPAPVVMQAPVDNTAAMDAIGAAKRDQAAQMEAEMGKMRLEMKGLIDSTNAGASHPTRAANQSSQNTLHRLHRALHGN
eukprot:COSAG05_NODE_2961_length_2461_cov_4.234124_5_plen_107_part_00